MKTSAKILSWLVSGKKSGPHTFDSKKGDPEQAAKRCSQILGKLFKDGHGITMKKC